MPIFAASLATLWADRPPMARLSAAAEAGFEWVEIPDPYDLNAADLRREMLRLGLRLALIACPPPNYTGGARGFAADPGQRGRFRRDLDRAARYADLLKPRAVQVLAGPGAGEGAADALRDNLAWAAARAPKLRLTLAPEAGSVAPTHDAAARMLNAARAPNLRLQLELGADALEAWERHGDGAGHVRFTASPSCDPALVEALFEAVDAAGYGGPLGAAYDPAGPTEPTLGWLRAHA